MEDERFDRLFADIDAAHAGEQMHERAGEFGDLVAGEIAEATLESRAAAAIGTPVELWAGAERIAGEMREVGSGWCLVAGADEVVVNLAALQSLRLGPRVRAAAGAVSVLSIGSPLRRWSAERRECRVTVGRRTVDGLLDAVAGDHLQLRRAGGGWELIPLAAVSAVRTLR